MRGLPTGRMGRGRRGLGAAVHATAAIGTALMPMTPFSQLQLLKTRAQSARK
jgi:hypothetical protein